MSRSRVRVGPGITHEVLAGEVIVYVPARGEGSPSTAIQLSGGTAQVFLRVVNGDHDVSPDLEHVEELMTLGVLVTDTTPSVSRRTALTTGAVGVGAGITLLALPQAAAAASAVVTALQGTWIQDPTEPRLQFSANHNYSGDPLTEQPPLTVVGIDGVVPWIAFQPAHPSGPRILWARLDIAAPNLPAPNTVFVGTFSQGGINYRATFVDATDYSQFN